MANQKLVAIAYCFAFLFVYLSSIAYAMLSGKINEVYETNFPQTVAMNATTNAVAGLSSISWISLLIIIIIISIILSILSRRAMSAAV